MKLEEFVAQIGQKFSDQELMKLAERAAQHSFDWTFQTGAVLARDGVLLAAAHNRVVPYETFSFHHGASKEKQLAPLQDLNYFDTNHAEVELILQALEKKSIWLGQAYILISCPVQSVRGCWSVRPLALLFINMTTLMAMASSY